MAQTIDVPKLIDSFTVFGTKIAESAANVNNILAEQNKATADQLAAIKEAGQATAENVRAKGEAQLQLQDRNAAAAAAVGVNPGAASYLLTSLGSSIIEKEDSIRKRDEGIKKKLDTKFLDDPLGFISDQISVQFDVAARNMEAVQTQQMNQQLAEASRRFTEQATTNAIITQNTTTKTIENEATIALAAAAEKAAKARHDAAQLGLQGESIRQATTKDQWNAVIQLQSAQNAQAQLALSQAASARDAQRLAMQQETHILQMAAAKDEKDARDAINAKLEKVAIATNTAQLTYPEFKALGQEQRARLEYLMSDPDVMTRGAFGSSPSRALNTMNLIPVNIPGLNKVRGALLEMRNTLAASKNPQVIAVMQNGKPEDKDKAADNFIKAQLQTQLLNIPESGSIYSPPSLLASLAIPAVAATPLGKTLAGLAVNNPQYPTKGTDVFQTALQMVRDNKGTPAELAAQIEVMYKSINSDNITNFQYYRIAIPSPDTFKTNIYIGRGDTFNSKVLDLTNRAQIEAELTRAAKFSRDPLRDFFSAPKSEITPQIAK